MTDQPQEPAVTIHCTDCGRPCPIEPYTNKHTGLPLLLPMCKLCYEKQAAIAMRFAANDKADDE